MNLGLTLLALIFLTVMAAAAGVRAHRTKVSPHGETLAVLGVAPGSGDAVRVPPASAKPKAPPAAR